MPSKIFNSKDKCNTWAMIKPCIGRVENERPFIMASMRRMGYQIREMWGGTVWHCDLFMWSPKWLIILDTEEKFEKALKHSKGVYNIKGELLTCA